MKIKDINFSNTVIKKHGLKEIKMQRLGKVVLIAGKNGAGKTRLLQAIQDIAAWRHSNHSLSTDKLDSEIAEFKKQLDSEKDYRVQYELNERLKKVLDNKLMKEALTANASADIPLPLINFVPLGTAIEPLSDQTLGMIAERSNRLRKVGIEYLNESTFSYIYTLQRDWHEATHAHIRNRLDSPFRETAISQYKKLEKMILEVLDSKLTRSDGGLPCLFGQPLDDTKLSDGQKVLLQLVVALHAQNQTLSDVILLLDEPETHLHPSALIDIIDRLFERIETGQLWICTHSIPLIAHIAALDPYAIWHMEDGTVCRAGRSPELILQGLLGMRKAIGNLEDFMRLPQDLALANFAAQSLIPPQAVETGPNDPQLQAISKAIHEIHPIDRPLHILDYGAGKGRLLGGLMMTQSNANIGARPSIDYVAYDEYSDDKSTCEAVIRGVFGSCDGRYYNDFGELATASRQGFDVVVLTNVLHEISPTQWSQLFSEGGLRSILSPNGWLLLVEDQRLPVGEKAHQFGFVLLDTPQLKTLFGVSPADEQEGQFIATDVKGDGRIKLHLIQTKLLSGFTADRQRDAIGELRIVALDKIKELRAKGSPTYDDGQLHGLWTQLYTNASLFLEL